ncbi:MAG: Asp-tRNA(Asn)/Glu-tRNA(Gln) amidotransferase subunit GatC [Oscillospiraceae bacterium]|nr:Asp-tRNA(Asn)/Glu-tRNA(Gln) amidotransferase subunit GatC [Oscillospiraceae bacterium]
MRDIKDYESMAKLALSETEREWVSARAERLIKSFAEIEGVDTGGVEPLITVLGLNNAFREDIRVKTVSREELLANAPEQYDGYFQVPKTLE